MTKAPPKYLHAVELRNQGKTRAGIAAEMGITTTRVSGLLHYARLHGHDTLTDHEMNPKQAMNYLRNLVDIGALEATGTIHAAVAPLTRADLAAIMRLNREGESFADTLVRVALDAAKTALKGQRPGSGP